MHEPSCTSAPTGPRRRAGVALTAAALLLSGLAATPASADSAGDLPLTEAEQAAVAQAAARAAVTTDAVRTAKAAHGKAGKGKAKAGGPKAGPRTPKPRPTTPPVEPPAPTAPGVVRYVDPAGDDGNDGATPATALRTLDAVSALDLEPGDEVRLRGGAVFSGTLLLGPEDAGTAEAPVRITGWQGRATVDAGTGSGVVVEDAGGVQVAGLAVVGSGQVGSGGTGVGVLFATDLDGGQRLAPVSVTDVDVSGFGHAGVEVGAWSASWSGYAAATVRDVVAHGNGDVGISTFGWFAPRSRQYSLTDVVVERSTATGNAGAGIVVDGALRGAVRDSTARGNGAGIVLRDSAHVAVRGNTAEGSVEGAGIAFAGGVYMSAMDANTTAGNAGPGLLVTQPAGFRMTAGNAVSRNTSTDDGRATGAALELSGPAGGSGVQDTDVFLNTVTAGSGAVRIADPVDTAAVHDNAFSVTGSGPLVDVTGGSDLLLFERNTYAGAFLVLWDGARFTRLADWRTATGQEPLAP